MTFACIFLRAWLLLACSLLSMAAFAGGAGTVVGVAGSASVVSADGKSRPLQKGALVNEGDTLVTGKDGHIDVRFSDDALVQLRPDSQFRIDEYVYTPVNNKPDGNEKGFFNLLKGGFRTVSGMIGKLRRSSYAVVTPTATIGIRGTDYSAALDDNLGLRVSVARGEIALDNRAGSFSVSEGQSAQVANADSAPNYWQTGGGAANGGAPRTGAAAGGGSVQVKGNTRIGATTDKTSAVAVGQGNRSTNQAGVIGGQ